VSVEVTASTALLDETLHFEYLTFSPYLWLFTWTGSFVISVKAWLASHNKCASKNVLATKLDIWLPACLRSSKHPTICVQSCSSGIFSEEFLVHVCTGILTCIRLCWWYYCFIKYNLLCIKWCHCSWILFFTQQVVSLSTVVTHQ
jgi:hypothetical protein